MFNHLDYKNTYQIIRYLRNMYIDLQFWKDITVYDYFITYTARSNQNTLKQREAIYKILANKIHEELWDDNGAIDICTKKLLNKSLKIASPSPNTIMELDLLIMKPCFQSYITLLCSAKMNTDTIPAMGKKVRQYKDAVQEYKTYYAACTSIQSVWRGAQHRIAKNKSIKKDAKP